jgi:hypothetical protein
MVHLPPKYFLHGLGLSQLQLDSNQNYKLISGNTVTFEDGSSEDFEVIVQSTGYKIDLNFPLKTEMRPYSYSTYFSKQPSPFAYIRSVNDQYLIEGMPERLWFDKFATPCK